MPVRNIFSIVFLSLSLSGMIGCRRGDGPTRISYSVHGTVESISPDQREVTIHHEAIPGYMSSMTMPFPVKHPRLLDGIGVHDRVLFELVVTPERATVDAIMVETSTATPAAPDASPKPADNARWLHAPRIGESIPDIVLTNQEGRRVRLANDHGKILAVNFIYTRCPLPNYCPHTMSVFARVANELKLNDSSDVRLYTISFDPRYDTPQKLAAYGTAYHVNPTYWQLLTGTSDEIARAVSFFGVSYWTANGQVGEHTLSTAIIDRKGHMAYFYTGPDTQAVTIAANIKTLLNQ